MYFSLLFKILTNALIGPMIVTLLVLSAVIQTTPSHVHVSQAILVMDEFATVGTAFLDILFRYCKFYSYNLCAAIPAPSSEQAPFSSDNVVSV